MQNLEFKIKDLGIRDDWIYYGEMPIVLLPIDFKQQCRDVRGDQVSIEFSNGQVLSFDINRFILSSE